MAEKKLPVRVGKTPLFRESTKELKQQFAEVASALQATDRLLKKGHVMLMAPTDAAMKEFVDFALKLHERGIKINMNVGSWDTRLLVTLAMVDPRIGRLIDQWQLKEELLKKHGDKLKRRKLTMIGNQVKGKTFPKKGAKQLPVKRKRLPK